MIRHECFDLLESTIRLSNILNCWKCSSNATQKNQVTQLEPQEVAKAEPVDETYIRCKYVEVSTSFENSDVEMDFDIGE